MCTVSPYDTLGPDSTSYIINHAGLSSVVCSRLHLAELLGLASHCPSLKLVVLLPDLPPFDDTHIRHSKSCAPRPGPSESRCTAWQRSRAWAGPAGDAPRPLARSDLATVNYTSGTTGVPKGVALTHANAVAGVAGALTAGTVAVKLPGEREVMLSYLPLAHILGRAADQTMLAVGYFRGDVRGLIDDLKALQPTTCTGAAPLQPLRLGPARQDGRRQHLGRRPVTLHCRQQVAGPAEQRGTGRLNDGDEHAGRRRVDAQGPGGIGPVARAYHGHRKRAA